ncbi:MAG: class I SAM-dependent methyltransferase [Candidatus Sungbacteria bacterium]|nr:class I SAM-dependent methyltransferase [Candidatus Sungbacteria bacterium]
MTMIIPNKAIKYILFQRTEYLLSMKSPLLNRFVVRVPSRMYNLAVTLEALLTKPRVKRLFQEDMEREYAILKPYLPAHARTILDIGAGVGGIDILLGKHYEQDKPMIYLLDKTEMPKKVYYGLEQKGCYYNSLSLAKDMLVQNGLTAGHIITQEADNDYRINFDAKFDLVISLISWGFHYPIATYLDQVYALLAPGGILILDVRKGTEEEIMKKFGNATKIFEARKYFRVMARK